MFVCQFFPILETNCSHRLMIVKSKMIWKSAKDENGLENILNENENRCVVMLCVGLRDRKYQRLKIYNKSPNNEHNCSLNVLIFERITIFSKPPSTVVSWLAYVHI